MTEGLKIERFQLFVLTGCPFCKKASNLLEKHGAKFSIVVMDKDQELLDIVKNNYGHGTVPIVVGYLDDTQHMLIGGFTELEKFFQVDKKPDTNFIKYKSVLTRTENFHQNCQKDKNESGT